VRSARLRESGIGCFENLGTTPRSPTFQLLALVAQAQQVVLEGEQSAASRPCAKNRVRSLLNG